MNLEDLIVEVRDRTLARVGLVNLNDLDVEFYPVHNGVGTWKLLLPSEHPMADHLREPGSGLIVTGPNDVILSGPTTKPEFVATPEDASGTVTFEGVTDDVILSDMLAWPDPSNEDIETQEFETDARTGAAETVMHAYVDANIGPSAPLSRRKTKLTMGIDGARGLTVTKAARFPQLGELLAEIAGPSSLGFRVVQRGDSLVFETYASLDRSRAVRLTIENGSLSSQKVAIAPPGVTRAIVAGKGSALYRQFVQRDSVASLQAEEDWGRRIEHFIDQRDTRNIDILNQAGDEAVAATGFTSVGAQAIPSEDTQFEFGIDWFLGDTVTVEIEGTESSVVVTGAIIKASRDGFRAGFLLGEESTVNTSAWQAAQFTSVAGRVSKLERTSASATRTGEVVLLTGTTARAGMLRCNGASILVASYPDLFDEIGYTYGGAGANFNVPPTMTEPNANLHYFIYA